MPAVRRMMKRGRDKGLYLRRPPELPRTLFPSSSLHFTRRAIESSIGNKMNIRRDGLLMGLPFACFKYFMYINGRVVGVGGGKAEQESSY